MADDFAAAANRHFDAADYLHQGARLVEASHLYAYAAECVLKAIVQAQKHPGKFWGHLNEHTLPKPKLPKPKSDLVQAYQILQQGRSALPLALPVPSRDFFQGWTVEARYQDASALQPFLTAHKQDAESFRQLFRQAYQQGVLV